MRLFSVLKMDKHLKDLYLNPDSSTFLVGVNPLYKKAKKKFPNIKIEDVEDYLSKQNVYTLHKPYKKYKPSKIIAVGKDADWQIDLADMSLLKSYNKNFAFILTCIDVLSKYGWAEPTKTKSADDVLGAFKRILASGRKPWRVFHDKGKEFLNKKFQNYLEENHIKSIAMENPITKAANVERYNRTLKTRLYKYFTLKNTFKWIDILPKIVSAINHSENRMHGMKPANVTFSNAQKVYNKLYKKFTNKGKKTKDYNIGDIVRISKERSIFEKGYLPSRTVEKFIIVKILHRKPTVYKLNDLFGEEIRGIFYRNELVKVKEYGTNKRK